MTASAKLRPELGDGSRHSGVPSATQIEAAKLKQVTSRRLGKTPPAWVDRVARGLSTNPTPA